MNEIHKYQKDNPDKYRIIDNLNVDRYDGYKTAFVLQSRNSHRYMWIGLIYLDSSKIDDFDDINLSLIPTTNVGGMTQKWLEHQITDTYIPTTDELQWNKSHIYHTNGLYLIKHLWSIT